MHRFQETEVLVHILYMYTTYFKGFYREVSIVTEHDNDSVTQSLHSSVQNNLPVPVVPLVVARPSFLSLGVAVTVETKCSKGQHKT